MKLIPKAVRVITKSNFGLYRSYNLARETTKLSVDAPSIIVYSGVKTGSSSIARSLRAAQNAHPVFHVHFLMEDSIREWECVYRDAFPQIRRIPQAYFESVILQEALARGAPLEGWKIVSGIRDPVGQHLSWFFYGIDVFKLPAVSYLSAGAAEDVESAVESLNGLFLSDIKKRTYVEGNHLLGWFDVELKRSFGIDVNEISFPKDKGYLLLRGNHPELLFYKVEALDSVAKAAFAELVGLENFKVVRENLGSSRSYAAVYKRFMDTAILPGDYLDAMYSSPVVTKFYTDREIERFRSRWTRH